MQSSTGTKFPNNAFCLSKATLFYEIHDVFKISKEIENEVLIYKLISECFAAGLTGMPVLLRKVNENGAGNL